MVNEFLYGVMGAPWWAWGILGYLIFIGLKASRDHTVYLPYLFILPSCLIGYQLLYGSSTTLYLLFLAIGSLLGFLLTDKKASVRNKKEYMVEIAGSYSTLIILLLFFLSQYIFGYLHATSPDLLEPYKYVNPLLKGLLTGYFLGRAVAYLVKSIKQS